MEWILVWMVSKDSIIFSNYFSILEDNIDTFLMLAKRLDVPRVIDYCKRELIAGCGGISKKKVTEIAIKWAFWDVMVCWK